LPTFVLANARLQVSVTLHAAAGGRGPWITLDHLRDLELGATIDLSRSPIWQLDLRRAPDPLENQATENSSIPYAVYDVGSGNPVGAPDVPVFRDLPAVHASVDDSEIESGLLRLHWNDFNFAAVVPPQVPAAYSGDAGRFDVTVTLQLMPDPPAGDGRLHMGLQAAGRPDGAAPLNVRLHAVRFPYLMLPALGVAPAARYFATANGGELLHDPIGRAVRCPDSWKHDLDREHAAIPGNGIVPVQAWYGTDAPVGLVVFDDDARHTGRRVVGTTFPLNAAQHWAMYQKFLAPRTTDDFARPDQVPGFTFAFSTADGFRDENGAAYGVGMVVDLFRGDWRAALQAYRAHFEAAVAPPVRLRVRTDVPLPFREIAADLWIADDPADGTVPLVVGDELWAGLQSALAFYRSNLPGVPLSVQPLPWVAPAAATPTPAAVPPNVHLGRDAMLVGDPVRLLASRMRPGLVAWMRAAHQSFDPLLFGANQDTGRIVTMSYEEETGSAPTDGGRNPLSNERPYYGHTDVGNRYCVRDVDGTASIRSDEVNFNACVTTEAWRTLAVREGRAAVDAFEGQLNFLKLTGAASFPSPCFAPALRGHDTLRARIRLSCGGVPSAGAEVVLGDVTLREDVDWQIGGTPAATLTSLAQALQAVGAEVVDRSAEHGIPTIEIRANPAFPFGTRAAVVQTGAGLARPALLFNEDTALVDCENEALLQVLGDPGAVPDPGLANKGIWFETVVPYESSVPWSRRLVGLPGSGAHAIFTFGGSPAATAANLAVAINGDAVLADCVRASAVGPYVRIVPDFPAATPLAADRGNGTRIFLDNPVGEHLQFAGGALAAANEDLDLHDDHPTGSSGAWIARLGEVHRAIQAHGRTAAANGVFYTSAERSSAGTSSFAASASEHVVPFPDTGQHTADSYFSGNAADLTLWQESVPAWATLLAEYVPRVGRLVALGTFVKRFHDFYGGAKDTAYKEDRGRRYFRYRAAYYVLVEGRPHAVALCSRTVTNQPEGFHGDRLHLFGRYDGFPGHPSLLPWVPAVQDFGRRLAELRSTFRDYLVYGRPTQVQVRNDLTSDFSADPQTEFLIQPGPNAGPTFFVRTAAQFGMSPALTVCWRRHGGGCFLVVAANYTGEPRSLRITLDWRSHFEESGQAAFRLTRKNVLGNVLAPAVGIGTGPAWRSPLLTLAPSEILVYEIEKLGADPVDPPGGGIIEPRPRD